VIGERHELGSGAFVDQLHSFVTADESAALFARLREELAWSEREIVLFGRRILQPRLVAWAGTLPYRYSGQTLPPRPFTPTVAGLVVRVNEALGRQFNHVLANRYRTGQDSMGMHADAEPELGPDPVVATLSFGTPRRMVIAPKKKGAEPRREVTLLAGDLLFMGGTCQRFFHHGIPRRRADEPEGERISLTLREVLRAPG
jgi:alkylated DNA repair dioxygenase AlkB